MAMQSLQNIRESINVLEDIQVGKKRKPYTITKSRETWSDEEHRKFLDALKLYDRDWRRIEQYIGTKNVIQIRSHAQKHFLKIQRNNTGEHIPPPRPKKKTSTKSKDSDPELTEDSHFSPIGSINPFLGNPNGYAQWLSESGAVGGGYPHESLLSWTTVGDDTNPTPSSAVPSLHTHEHPELHTHHHHHHVHHVPPPPPPPQCNPALQHQPQLAQPSTMHCAQQEVLNQIYLKQQQHQNQKRQLQQAYSDAQPVLHLVLNSASSTQPSDTDVDYSRVIAFISSLFDASPSSHLETFKSLTVSDREMVRELTSDLALSLAVQLEHQNQESCTDMLQHYHSLMQRCVLACQQQMEAAHDFADTVVTPPPPSNANTPPSVTPSLPPHATAPPTELNLGPTSFSAASHHAPCRNGETLDPPLTHFFQKP